MTRSLRYLVRSRLRLTLVVALVLALVTAVSAFGYYTSAGAGTGSANAGTVNPPTNVAVPTSSTGTVHVAWTASVGGPGSIAPTGYYAERKAGGLVWAPACDLGPSALVNATDCDDTVSADGDYIYRVTAVYHSWTATSGTSSSVHVDSTAPSVTVEQSTGQSDPTNSLPMRWAVSFTEPVTGFDASDLTRSGTATGGTVAVTGSGASYEISLAGPSTDGTVSFSIDAGRAQDAAGNGNTSSSSTDNTVAYDATAPSVTVEQKTGQSDPTNSLPLRWAVSFTEPVTGFDASDVTRGGTATGGTVSVSGAHASYEISLDGSPTNGTVSFTIGANRAQDSAGNGNTASTSTDNAVAYDTVAPFVKLVQKAGQADPTNSLPIRFTVLFGEPVADFDASDVSLGGTAGGGSVSVTGSGQTYEIVVSGPSSDGTVTASVGTGKAHDAAGNASAASLSVDNSVAYDATAPSVTVEQKAGQADPAKVLPMRWAVTFAEPVAGFDAGDLIRSGTSTGGTVDVTGSGASYEIALTGTPTNGTVSFSVGANRAQDAAGNGSTASTSSDNTVVYDDVAAATTIAISPSAPNGANGWYSSAATSPAPVGAFLSPSDILDRLLGTDDVGTAVKGVSA